MHRVMYPSFFMLNEIRVKNASAFAFKRKYVLLETQVRLTLNVSAFWIIIYNFVVLMSQQ